MAIRAPRCSRAETAATAWPSLHRFDRAHGGALATAERLSWPFRPWRSRARRGGSRPGGRHPGVSRARRRSPSHRHAAESGCPPASAEIARTPRPESTTGGPWSPPMASMEITNGRVKAARRSFDRVPPDLHRTIAPGLGDANKALSHQGSSPFNFLRHGEGRSWSFRRRVVELDAGLAGEGIDFQVGQMLDDTWAARPMASLARMSGGSGASGSIVHLAAGGLRRLCGLPVGTPGPRSRPLSGCLEFVQRRPRRICSTTASKRPVISTSSIQGFSVQAGV